MGKSLLVVFAHPDDEAFGVGGTLAKYAASGVDITLVCATRGEAGEVADPELATSETLGRVREDELRCAAQYLGIDEVIFLSYRDSGMEGDADNLIPEALMNAPAEEVIHSLVTIIRRVRPEVVVTFEPNGVYGHPDHIAINRHTVAAFHAASDVERYPESGEAWRPKRMFFTVIPQSFFSEMRDQLEAMKIDTSDFSRFEENVVAWPDKLINVSLDVTETIDNKWAALHCHRTQFSPDNIFRRLPEEVGKQMMSREHFALAWPEAEPGLELSDLFADLES